MGVETLLHLRTEGLWVVIGGMGGLSAFVVVELVRQKFEMAAEKKRLTRLSALAVAPLESDEELRDSDSFDQALRELPKSSLVRRTTEAVLAVRAQQAPNLEPIMGMLVGGEATRLGWVRAAPNMYMLLGLFGTVLGLAGSIGSLGPQIKDAATAVNPGQLSNALGTTLGQMQDAFGCSLWGIILSFACGGLLTVVTAQRGRFMAQVERYALTELVPAVLPRSSEELFERQQKLIRGTANTFRQFDATMNQTIGKFDQLIGVTGVTLEKTLRQLAVVATQMNSSLERITDGVRDLGLQLGASANTLADAQREGASSLAIAQENAALAFQNAEHQLGMQLGTQVKMIDAVQNGFTAHTNMILESVTSAAERLDRTVESIQAGSAVAGQETQNLVTHLSERFERLERVLGEQVEDNQRAVSLSFEGMTELSQRLLSSAEALINVQQVGASSLEFSQREAAGAQRQFEQQQILQSSAQVKMVQELQQSFSVHANHILGSVAATSDRLDKTVESIQNGSNSARQENQNLVEHLSQRFEQLERVLDQRDPAPGPDSARFPPVSPALSALENTGG